jgi:alpha-L-arabinofuranosidase
VGDVSAYPNASLAVTFSGPGALLVDVVSLLPADNVAHAAAAGAMNPWPFRADLLQMLKDLQPRLINCSCRIERTAALTSW